MYEPIQDGIEKSMKSVCYTETAPPDELSGVVHCFWELKTETILTDDFFLHALPDACINILFNQLDTRIAGVTALQTTFEVLNLGREFHYVGIQFLPGVWQGNPSEIKDKYVGTSYKGELPLIETSTKLARLDFHDKQSILSDLVQRLVDRGIVVANNLTEKIFANIDDIHNVGDMAAIVGVSPRQLQRTLKKMTGFPPHDLLKVLRLQRSFRQGYLGSYADQSHFIHSFRTMTGYTPEQYVCKFGV